MEFGGWSIALRLFFLLLLCYSVNVINITVSMNAVNVNRACIKFHTYIKHTDPLLY